MEINYSDEELKKLKEGYLKQKQSLPLEAKIILTKKRIREWYDRYQGDVYISFSGGKDSTVLLDIARQVYKEISAVFCDPGLEYPELKEFVKTKENVIVIRPKMSFKDVIKKYGYPVVSKEQSHYISKVRNSKSEALINKHLNGINKDGSKSQFIISKKWRYLVDAPFKISDKCCDIMKKQPFEKFEKETGLKGIVGTLAEESSIRKRKYLKNGCNSFDEKRPLSAPLSFWTEQDILEYIYINKLPIAQVYGEVVKDSGLDFKEEYRTTLCKRTGCIYCMFGLSYDTAPNRFQMLKESHPTLHEYCMNELGIRKVLKYMNFESE
ncbi:phosphoadenosine phosphosulfate reductase family protein [Clostridioides difficile]|nr:phosphoadenosine phosphosulfate reductase family protein [Clostridioides difficile]